MKRPLITWSPYHFIALFVAAYFALIYTTPVYAVGEPPVNTTSLADDPFDGKCSLREALQAAFNQKTTGKASVTYNECSASAGPTTITFAGDAASGVLTLKPTDALLPMIIKEVIIVGPVTLRGSGPQPANATHKDTRLFWLEGDGVLTLMVEGGAQTARAFLAAGLVDRLMLYRAPFAITGGVPALPELTADALARPGSGWTLIDHRVLGSDTLAVYEPSPCSPA